MTSSSLPLDPLRLSISLCEGDDAKGNIRDYTRAYHPFATPSIYEMTLSPLATLALTPHAPTCAPTFISPPSLPTPSAPPIQPADIYLPPAITPWAAPSITIQPADHRITSHSILPTSTSNHKPTHQRQCLYCIRHYHQYWIS